MESLAQRETPQLLLDLILGGLRVPDESLNEIALELLSRFGERPIRRLVLEAVSNKNGLAFRLQAIRALSRLAKYANPMDTMDLALLLNDRNQQVREAGRDLCG